MPEPLYRQIADDLIQKIDTGVVGAGEEPLPTEMELREMYGASRNTVRDAMKLLISRGLVETRPGKGTFVIRIADPFVTPLSLASGFGDDGTTYRRSDPEASPRKADKTEPRIEVQQATGFVADELQLDPSTTVVSRHQQRSVDGVPWSLQTSYYPMDFVTQGATELLQAKDMRNGTVRYLEETLGIKQAGWFDRITVRPPDPNEVMFFKIPVDGRISMFEVSRTAYSADGKPIRLTITSYPSDMNQFVVTVGKVPKRD
jgi:GntR family transcriptional regulator